MRGKSCSNNTGTPRSRLSPATCAPAPAAGPVTNPGPAGRRAPPKPRSSSEAFSKLFGVPRPNSTLVIVAGADAPKVVARLGGFANVRAAAVPDAGAARELVAQAHAAYVVHDADPLAEVAAAWARFFDGADTPGTLEVSVEATLAAL